MSRQAEKARQSGNRRQSENFRRTPAYLFQFQ
ncbi:hypothetical protein STENM36S_04591 [Streptomyces tendae]